MGLFDMFKNNKMPHHLGLITLYKDLVYWVDDTLGLKNIQDIQLERGELYSFCCVVTIKMYEAYIFGIRDKTYIKQEILEEYYQSIIQILKSHYKSSYNSAYQYLKDRDMFYKNLHEQSLTTQDWSIIVNKFVYCYTKLEGLDEQKYNLSTSIANKCNEHLHFMNNNFK